MKYWEDTVSWEISKNLFIEKAFYEKVGNRIYIFALGKELLFNYVETKRFLTPVLLQFSVPDNVFSKSFTFHIERRAIRISRINVWEKWNAFSKIEKAGKWKKRRFNGIKKVWRLTL